jgi:hypothetical protein
MFIEAGYFPGADTAARHRVLVVAIDVVLGQFRPPNR